jgi:hypothetical protein
MLRASCQIKLIKAGGIIMNQIDLFKSIVDTITTLLNSQEFLDAHRFPNRFVRKRILSMSQVVMFLLYSTKQALHQNISRIIDLDPVHFPDVSKQAVSKARQGIKPSLFRDLFNVTVDAFSQSSIPLKLWRGKERVFAIDGSKIQLPNSSSNYKTFGEMFSRLNPAKRWSLALISVIYDVTNDYICHGLIRPYLSSERAAAIDHCKSLEALGFLKGSVLVFDRGYFSETMFRYFANNGYFCVMRLKEDYRLSKSCNGDTTSFLGKEGEEKIKIRVLAIDLGNGTTEYLATNLFNPDYTREDFKELYFLRWGCELKYDELKNQLLLEEFNGATSISVEQEFYINLLYSNLASLVKTSADAKIEETADPDNKYRYQANRSFIIGRIKNILVPVICHQKTEKEIDILFQRACRFRSQIQPGRNDPRNRVKRDRSHFNNRKTAV